jgi:spore maturation protein CgeB
MTFVDIKTQLNDFFDDDEVVFYKNVDDLSQKLNYFRENNSSRKKIARKGQVKYFRYFNSVLITKYMLSKAFGTNLVNKKKWMDS